MTTVEVVTGDLLSQNVDVIVNAWNRNIILWWLLLPQGVSGAIKRKAGLQPFRELPWRPIPLGHAVITSAGRLPYKAIIHVAGIDGFWRASRKSIFDSVVSAVALAHQRGFTSIAFPTIGAGSGGFDAQASSEIMREALAQCQSDMRVAIVHFGSVKRDSPYS